MARKLVRVNWDAGMRGTGAGYDAWALEFRDAFRSKLDPDLNHTDWLVTDITRWDGNFSNGFPHQAYAFAVWHMSSGTPTGPAWLFILPGQYYNSTQPNNSSPWLSGYFQNPDNYFRTVLGDSQASQNGAFHVHYCETGSTSTPYGVGWDADGALPGGDLSAPASNPYVDSASFMPALGIRGHTWNFMSSYSGGHWAGQSKMAALFDDTKPFMALYMRTKELLYPRGIYIAGKICEPYLPTDTNRNMVLAWVISFSSTTQGSTNQWGGLAYDETATVVPIFLDYTTAFTENNTPLPGGDAPWEVVTAYSDNYLKGYVDSDILRVMGPANSGFFQLYDDGNFVKYHQHLCFPYVSGETIFPTG